MRAPRIAIRKNRRASVVSKQFSGQVLARLRRQDSIRDAPRKNRRPFVHCLVGDAYSLGGGSGRTSEEFNGL